MRMCSWLVSMGLIGALVVPASAGIFVVDAANGPGTDFTTLTAALNAVSATGGTLLVRSGTYVGPHSVTLAATAGELVIVADDGATVRIESPIQSEPKTALAVEVASGATPRRVVLRGLTLAQTDNGGPLVDLLSGVALGVGCVTDTDPVDVFVDECTATETIGTAASVAYGRRIVVTNSVFVGGTPILVIEPNGNELAYTFPGSGLAMFGTKAQHTAWVFSSWLQGGPGRPVHFKIGNTQDASEGGTGYFAWQNVVPSTVPWGIVDCDIVGGVGGAGAADSFPSCYLPGDGGPGLDSWTQTQTYSVDSTYGGGAAGAPGAHPACALVTADPGPAIAHGYSTFTGFHTALDGRPGRALAPRTLREGQTKPLGVEGQIGDTAFLFVGATQTAAYAYAISGALVVDPLLLLPIGVIGPSGSVTIQATLPNLGAGIDGFPLFTQAFTAEAGTGYIRAGSPAVTLLLDSQF